MQQTAIIIEQGNGFPNIGELITINDILYTVIEYNGPIHTDRLGGNYHYAAVEYYASIWSISEERYDDLRPVKVMLILAGKRLNN